MASDADIRRIHERLDTVVADLTEIKEGMAERKGVARNCQAMNEKHERILIGENGTPGMVADVAEIKRDHATARARLKTAWAIIIGLVSSIAGAIAEAWLGK